MTPSIGVSGVKAESEDPQYTLTYENGEPTTIIPTNETVINPPENETIIQPNPPSGETGEIGGIPVYMKNIIIAIVIIAVVVIAGIIGLLRRR